MKKVNKIKNTDVDIKYKSMISKRSSNTKPKKYITPTIMQLKIDEYFDSGCNTKKVKDEIIKVPTISGLVEYLGFKSISSFYDYEKNDLYSDVIKLARLKISSYYEEKLIGNNVAGPIFALKNLGWSDKSQDESNYKDSFLRLFLMFNNFIQHKNLQLASELIEQQKEFIDLLLQSSNTDHLEILLKEKETKLLSEK